MTDDRKGLARFDAERDVAQDPICVRRFGNIAVAKPNVAKFDFAARLDERDGVGIGLDGDRLGEELENALRCSHGGLQDVEFLAEVLNGPEEALGIHCEFDKHADGEGAMKYAITSVPENHSNGGKAQEFHRGGKERVGQDGVAPGKHVVVIAIGKLDRKSTRLNSSHGYISYAVFCLKKKTNTIRPPLAPGPPRPNTRAPKHGATRSSVP